jgi:hypothetical protein
MIIISLLYKLILNKESSQDMEDQPEEIVVYLQRDRTVDEEEFLKIWRIYNKLK